MNDNKIQIIKDDEIDLRALFQVLWNDRKRIIQITASLENRIDFHKWNAKKNL